MRQPRLPASHLVHKLIHVLLTFRNGARLAVVITGQCHKAALRVNLDGRVPQPLADRSQCKDVHAATAGRNLGIAIEVRDDGQLDRGKRLAFRNVQIDRR